MYIYICYNNYFIRTKMEREAYIYKSIHIGNGICHMLVQFSIKAQKPHCIQTCKCRLLQKKFTIVLQYTVAQL